MRMNAERHAEAAAERRVSSRTHCCNCLRPLPPRTHPLAHPSRLPSRVLHGPPRSPRRLVRQGDPLQQLRMAGVKVKPVFDLAAHTATEALEGLLPWNGKEDNLIDRFDGRALLDFYRDAPPRAPQPKTDDELELEQKVRCLSRHSFAPLPLRHRRHRPNTTLCGWLTARRLTSGLLALPHASST
jgi:hypothetical protein